MGMYNVKAKVQIEVEMVVSDPCIKNADDAIMSVRDHVHGNTPTFLKSVDLKTAVPTNSGSWEAKMIRKK